VQSSEKAALGGGWRMPTKATDKGAKRALEATRGGEAVAPVSHGRH
jgi:hypothetical protein